MLQTLDTDECLKWETTPIVYGNELCFHAVKTKTKNVHCFKWLCEDSAYNNMVYLLFSG